MVKSKHVSLREIVIIVLLCLYAAFSFNESINSIMLYTAVPAAFVLSLFSPQKKLNYSIKCCLYLYGWIALTAFFSIDYAMSLSYLKKSVGVLMLIIILHRTATSERMVSWLYGVWVVLYIAVVKCAYDLYISGNFEFGMERLSSEDFNPNMLGYYTFYMTFIVFIMPHFVKSPTVVRFLHILFLLIIPWSFFLSILTGTRQIIIIQAPLLMILLYIRYIINSRRKRSLAGIIVLIALIATVVLSLNKLSGLYSDSVLRSRSEQSIGDDERTVLFRDAIDVGLSHPVVGVGPGCYQKISVLKLYSHNTYTELFADSGFIALLIFLIMGCNFIYTQYHRYRESKDPVFLSFSCFGVFYMLDSFFNVVYIIPWLFPFFMLVVSHSDLYLKNKISIK